MPVQSATQYATTHGAAYAGMIATAFELCNIVSKINKGTAIIPFGIGVVSDGDDGAKVPVQASTAKNFIGVSMRELNRAYTDPTVVGASAKYDYAVITSGDVWVTASVAVTKDQDVYLIVGDGTGTNQGKFSNVVGAGATLAVLIPNAKWETAAAAGKLARITLNIGG